MNQSICIIVVAGHRTGSSCVTSMLQELGIPMGVPPKAETATVDEQWEDQDFVNLHREMICEPGAVPGTYWPQAWQYPVPKPTRDQVDRYVSLVCDRAKQPLWGFKDPRYPFVMDFALGLLLGNPVKTIDVRFVWLSRGLWKVADSLKRRDSSKMPMDYFAVASHQQLQWSLMRKRYGSFPGVSLTYEDLLASPTTAAETLAGILPEQLPRSADVIARTAALVRQPA